MATRVAKDETLKVRLTAAELSGIRQKAEDQETTVSALVRAGLSAVLNGRPVLTPKDAEVLGTLRDEVRRVGVNLNTLLRSVHLEQHGVSPDGPRLADYRALSAELQTVMARLVSATDTLPL